MKSTSSTRRTNRRAMACRLGLRAVLASAILEPLSILLASATFERTFVTALTGALRQASGTDEERSAAEAVVAAGRAVGAPVHPKSSPKCQRCPDRYPRQVLRGTTERCRTIPRRRRCGTWRSTGWARGARGGARARRLVGARAAGHVHEGPRHRAGPDPKPSWPRRSPPLRPSAAGAARSRCSHPARNSLERHVGGLRVALERLLDVRRIGGSGGTQADEAHAPRAQLRRQAAPQSLDRLAGWTEPSEVRDASGGPAMIVRITPEPFSTMRRATARAVRS